MSKKIAKTVVKAWTKESRERIAEYRREASRKAAMANKRLKRLEEGGLKSSPAFAKWELEGGIKFGVKGKTHNELQAEVARMDRFINSHTSTVRGTHNTLKEMARNTGMKYVNVKDLIAMSAKFFELASKVEQYLRQTDDMASAIGYQKIWEAINEYVEEESINLADAKNDIDSMIEAVTNMLKAAKNAQTEIFTTNEWYKP